MPCGLSRGTAELNTSGGSSTNLRDTLIELCHALVSQERARVVVPPQANAPGYWFGGGNLSIGPDGCLYLIGRYRNAGDSRTGVSAGERGLELSVFRSEDRGRHFEKVLSFSKDDLSLPDRQVLSIEGSAMCWSDEGVELFVSTEKDGIGYPPGFESYLKPGTGVWTIDRLRADSLADLPSAAITTVLQNNDPQFIHVKDPFLYTPSSQVKPKNANSPVLFFCSHPFGWTSSNTGFATRSAATNSTLRFEPTYEFFSRGLTWDVAMSRGTAILDIPQIGVLSDQRVSLLFYDGGECIRDHDEHTRAVRRPRGYSCEELGGAAYFLDGEWHTPQRLSTTHPLFVSPHGTGCSRYVDALRADDGIYATWQQSQADGSQPLVLNFLPREELERILS